MPRTKSKKAAEPKTAKLYDNELFSSVEVVREGGRTIPVRRECEFEEGERLVIEKRGEPLHGDIVFVERVRGWRGHPYNNNLIEVAHIRRVYRPKSYRPEMLHGIPIMETSLRYPQSQFEWEVCEDSKKQTARAIAAVEEIADIIERLRVLTGDPDAHILSGMWAQSFNGLRWCRFFNEQQASRIESARNTARRNWQVVSTRHARAVA